MAKLLLHTPNNHYICPWNVRSSSCGQEMVFYGGAVLLLFIFCKEYNLDFRAEGGWSHKKSWSTMLLIALLNIISNIYTFHLFLLGVASITNHFWWFQCIFVFDWSSAGSFMFSTNYIVVNNEIRISFNKIWNSWHDIHCDM